MRRSVPCKVLEFRAEPRPVAWRAHEIAGALSRTRQRDPAWHLFVPVFSARQLFPPTCRAAPKTYSEGGYY